MKIIYSDNSVLEVSYIEISGRELYCDDIYVVNIEDIDHIEDD